MQKQNQHESSTNNHSFDLVNRKYNFKFGNIGKAKIVKNIGEQNTIPFFQACGG